MQPYLDDDPDLRIFIADILGYCRSHRHQSALLLGDALLKDPEVNVRYQAAVSLGNLAFPESVGDLCQAMHDEEWVQFAVVEALAKIKDPSAINALVQLLPQSSMLVSSAIIDALGGLGDIKTILRQFNSSETSAWFCATRSSAIVQILSDARFCWPPNREERLRAPPPGRASDNDDIQMAALQGLPVPSAAE